MTARTTWNTAPIRPSALSPGPAIGAHSSLTTHAASLSIGSSLADFGREFVGDGLANTADAKALSANSTLKLSHSTASWSLFTLVP